MVASILPVKAVGEPLKGELGARVKEVPLDMVPLMDVAEVTLPVTGMLAVPPPLNGVLYDVAFPENEHAPVMVGITTVSPGALFAVAGEVWKNTASPAELINPGPEAPPLLSVQSPTTL
jgi:hypothetical protein